MDSYAAQLQLADFLPPTHPFPAHVLVQLAVPFMYYAARLEVLSGTTDVSLIDKVQPLIERSVVAYKSLYTLSPDMEQDQALR